MNITLQAAHLEDRGALCRLQLAPAQEGFVETVAQCLQEAQALALWRPTAIYADGLLVGFAMYGKFAEEGTSGRVWLDRFLIDRHHQGKGIGKAALQKLLEHLAAEYSCTEIFLSLYAQNSAALHLYQAAGFAFTGELDINGEQVMCKSC